MEMKSTENIKVNGREGLYKEYLLEFLERVTHQEYCLENEEQGKDK